MVRELFSLGMSSLLWVHTSLYHPTFPPLPILREERATLPEALTLPVKRPGAQEMPAVRAASIYAVDLTSGEVLISRSPDKRLFPASTTKMMTGLLALETYDMSKVASIGASVVRDGRVMWLVPGEQIAYKDLVTATLVHSANDAAQVLADLYPGGSTAFVERMNERAAELSMKQTTFTNPSGLFSPRHVTSVRDLVHLTRVAMTNPTFASIVASKSATVTSVDGKIVHRLESTNQLLGKVAGVEGVKTGWTEEAGECLVTQVTRDGHTVVIALLSSPDRFGETTKLIEWIYETYEWKTQSVADWGKDLSTDTL